MSAAIRDLIAQGSLSPFNAMGIIRAVCEQGFTRDAILEAVEDLAKGPDGVANTSDDLIPMPTVMVLTTLLRTGVVHDMIDWFASKDADAEDDQHADAEDDHHADAEDVQNVDTYRPEDVQSVPQCGLRCWLAKLRACIS